MSAVRVMPPLMANSDANALNFKRNVCDLLSTRYQLPLCLHTTGRCDLYYDSDLQVLYAMTPPRISE